MSRKRRDGIPSSQAALAPEGLTPPAVEDNALDEIQAEGTMRNPYTNLLKQMGQFTADMEAASADERVLTDPAPSVVVSSYKASSVEYSLRVWVKTPDYWDAYFALNESCRTYLEKAGQSMAFERLDVRIIEGK